MLSLQLTKLIEDIVCNTADLVLKNIIAPTELFNQSVTLPASESLVNGLFLPVFILVRIFSKAFTYGFPNAASSLFMFSSENIRSTLVCHCSKYFFLFIELTLSNKSVVILPASHPSLGAEYSSFFWIAISCSAKSLSSESLFT